MTNATPQMKEQYAVPDLPSRIPSLDGLRAVSIALVIIGHSAEAVNAPHFLVAFSHLGNFGVRCFFIISGFLITTLMLKEQRATGTISMSGFYTRRAIRIFPASLTYIGIIAVCASFGLLTLKSGDLLHALTYTMNYRYNPAQWFRHLWSLSVEEQFYFIWPGLLWLAGTKRSSSFAWMVVLIDPILRGWMWFFLHASDSAMTKHFESIADTLATGCLLCIYFNRMSLNKWYCRFYRSKFSWIPACLLVLSGNALFIISQASFYIAGQTIANLGTALCIDLAIRRYQIGIGSLLNLRPVAYVGTLSYSLYLWQNAFLNPGWDGWPARLPVSLLCTAVMATASFYLVEKPALRLKSLGRSKARPLCSSAVKTE